MTLSLTISVLTSYKLIRLWYKPFRMLFATGKLALLRLNKFEKYPDWKDCTNVVFPTPECPKNFKFTLDMGCDVGTSWFVNCSLKTLYNREGNRFEQKKVIKTKNLKCQHEAPTFLTLFSMSAIPLCPCLRAVISAFIPSPFLASVLHPARHKHLENSNI